jgi:chemosensory pili system protein ChpA (sensor histidine kinase/response regulator)
MEPPHDIAAPHDLSALAWVHEELRKSLETAQRALRRYMREAEASAQSDLDDVEPSILRTARQQLHLGVGALELVNIPEGAMLLRASEALVQRFVAKPQRLDAAGVEAIEHASFALLDYLGRRLAGKPVDPVGLFPQLRRLLELNGAERIHPADLSPQDWRWRPVPAALRVGARPADAAMLSEFEKQLLTLVRTNAPNCGLALRRDCCALATSSGAGEETVFWRLAAGFFDALAARGIDTDVFVKRTASRVLGQLRSLVKAKTVPDRSVSERLAQDLLFHCSRALCAPGEAPCLDAVRVAYELLAPPMLDYNAPAYGLFDPAWVQQARKRTDAAKDVWSGVASGESQRLPGLVETFTLVGESIRRLYPHGERLADTLMNAAEQTFRRGRPTSPELAMEVATSLLYLEASLEDREFDHPEQAIRVERLAARLDNVSRGLPAEPLEPWMEELYRRISDRQTMGSVVQELRASLSEAERQIDQFFRNPRETALLVPVPPVLVTMRGVLTVLGIEQACQAAERMAADVQHLIDADLDANSPQALATFQRLAGNLGALGFLIDMLSVQPQLTRVLFSFDPASGVLAPVMGRHAMAPDLIQRAQAIAAAMRRDGMSLEDVADELRRLSSQPEISAQPALAASLSSATDALIQAEEAGAGRHTEDAVREHIAQAMDDFVATATSPMGLEPVAATPFISRPMDLNPPAFEPTGLEDDHEMREVFLEESGEVLAEARAALQQLEQTPNDQTQIVTVRRAFHTLKGSSRMVGLSAFGDAAWSCEQLYNRWLADQASASAELRVLTADVLRYFAAWADAIAAHDDEGFAPEPIIAAADTLRLAGELMHVPLPGHLQPRMGKPAAGRAPFESVGVPAAAPPVDAAAVDLAFPFDEPVAGAVFETLEATRPAPLDSPDALEPEEALPMFDAESIDLVLDPLVGSTLADVPRPVPAATPTPPAPVEPAPVESLAASFDGLDFDLADVEEIDVDLELAPLSGDTDMPLQPALPPVAAPPVEEPVPEVADALASAESPAAEIPADVAEPAGPPLVAQPEEGVDLPLSFDMLELPSMSMPLDTAANEEPWPTLPDALPLTRPAELYALHAPDTELPEIVTPTGMAALRDETPPPAEPDLRLEMELALDLDFTPAAADVPPPEASEVSGLLPAAPSPVEEPARQPAAPDLSDDQFKIIGPLRLPIPLFNIYLNEADELSRRLGTELAEWSLELDRPVGEVAVSLAHSLAGSSATVGFRDLSQLSRELEHALMRSEALGSGKAEDAELFIEAAEEIRRLLHQFAAGFLQTPPVDLSERLQSWEEQMQEKLDDWARHPEHAPAVESLPLPLLPETESAPLSAIAGLFPATAEPALSDSAFDLTLEPVEPAPLDSPIGPAAEPVWIEGNTDDESPTAEQPVDFSLELADTRPHAVPSAQEIDVADLTLSELDMLVPDVQPEAAGPSVPLDQLPVLDQRIAAAEQELVEPAAADLELDLDLALPDLVRPESMDGPPPGASVPVLHDTVDPGTLHRGEPGAVTAEPDDLHEVVDADLFPVFQEEAEELLPLLGRHVRAWLASPADLAAGTACMRVLHTFKGGARLSGAMRLGDLAHRFETLVEQLLTRERVHAADLSTLQARADELVSMFDAVRSRFMTSQASVMAPLPMPSVLAPLRTEAGSLVTRPVPIGDFQLSTTQVPAPAVDDGNFGPDPGQTRAAPLGDERDPAPIDWSRLVGNAPAAPPPAERGTISVQPVRVRPQLLDRLVNLAGEVSITRARLESEVGQIRSSLADLTDNLDRLHKQLSDIAIQAETQMESRLEAARVASQAFDPLEMDRYTRLQELTRMMAESVNDVATVRGTMLRTLQTAEDELAAQARLTRELQSDLLRTRMTEFESLTERLQRVVRLAAGETGKQVRLDIVGGSIEVDRGVLDRMTPAFEHLLRNCVTHGIEPAAQRVLAGKEPTGSIVVAVEQDGNEVAVELRDDGAGLDLGRIRERARAMGLIAPGATPSDQELTQLIFAPGLSTMVAVTELAGRGVGMDVVRADVQALGGRIETNTAAGHGTSFKLVLPLTTVVTQVVMLRTGSTHIAVPSYLIEQVQRATPQSIDKGYRAGAYLFGGLALPFYWLGALLQTSGYGSGNGRSQPVVIVRSAQQRVALHVDEVLGNHEVVVKNLGTQLSRVPGLAGMTLLASGAVALIYNPVALASVYGEQAQRATQVALAAPAMPQPGTDAGMAPPPPLVLVVDDSLTVRRVTKRLLDREGYRVALAKDGLEALEALGGERPVIVLSDIEMPRMDGFDLLRNIRADAVLNDLPVVMITSRIAQKHRELAMQLGANHYLGKPYSEEELLGLIASYVNGEATQPG